MLKNLKPEKIGLWAKFNWHIHVLVIYKRTDDGSERTRKKNTAPWWSEKQKVLGAKGRSWRSKNMETTVYQLSTRKKYKLSSISLHLLICCILNNKRWKWIFVNFLIFISHVHYSFMPLMLTTVYISERYEVKYRNIKLKYIQSAQHLLLCSYNVINISISIWKCMKNLHYIIFLLFLQREYLCCVINVEYIMKKLESWIKYWIWLVNWSKEQWHLQYIHLLVLGVIYLFCWPVTVILLGLKDQFQNLLLKMDFYLAGIGFRIIWMPPMKYMKMNPSK